MQQLTKYIRYAFALLRAHWFCWLHKNATNPSSSTKKVFFDVPYTDYHRYLYVLVLFFIEKNYAVYIRPYPRRVARFSLDKYGQKLLTHPNVNWTTNPPKSVMIFNSKNLSSDYFESNGFHVPMCQHPAMYEQFLAEYYPQRERKKVLCFAGDFREELYTTISKRNFFAHPNRLEMREYVEQSCQRIGVALEVIDNAKRHLSAKEYRNYLASHTFFLGLPGIHMPLSHNLVEALSLGCIPFIHSSYNACVHPPLTHMQNAYIFDDFKSLDADIRKLYELSDDIIDQMSIAAKSYYKSHLSVDAVVDALAKTKETVLLLAEWNSIPTK